MNSIGKVTFTLVELLVLVAVICILAALLIPGLQKTLRTTRLTSCANNQFTIYSGVSFYADSSNSRALPVTGGGWNGLPYAATYTTSAIGHQFTGLGVVYAQGFIADAATFLEPDWQCTGSSPTSFSGSPLTYSISKDGVDNLAPLKPRAPFTIGGNYLSTFWAALPYTFLCYHRGLGPARRLGIPPVSATTGKPSTTALVLCHTGILGEPAIGAHKFSSGQSMNALFEDGHVRTFVDVQTQLTLQKAITGSQWKTYTSSESAAAVGDATRSIWTWAMEMDRK